MSLDQFRSLGDNQSDTSGASGEPEDVTSWDCNWHIKLDGYWDNVSEKYFGDDTPNQPPLMAVPEKLAAELHIVDDPELVEEVGEFWAQGSPDEYVEVFKIVFNDLSTFHVPLRPWSKDYAMIRDSLVKQYLPEVVKWEAVLDGENPDEVLDNWLPPWEEEDPDWFEDVDKTGLSESTRKWLNEEKNWLPHIDKKIESNGNVDLDLDEDDDWADDW